MAQQKTYLYDETAYQECVEHHRKFHTVAGEVARLINMEKYEEARRALASGSEYAASARQVCNAIRQLSQAIRPQQEYSSYSSDVKMT